MNHLSKSVVRDTEGAAKQKPHATFCGNRGRATAPGDPVRSQQCDLLTRHIAMRLHHAEKTAGTLPTDTPEREHARAVIVTEIDRLHWRIWNGKAKDAKLTLERIRAVMPVFQGEQGDRKRDPSSRRRRCARSTAI